MSRTSQLVATAAVLAVGSLLLSGCGTPAGGDPGGHRLKELANDGAFAKSPDGATGVRTTLTKAKYVKPGFTGGGWHGPGVLVGFTSTAPPADVYGFYDRRAQAAGWHPAGSGTLGTDSWAKTYPDGASATLLLLLLTRGGTRDRTQVRAGGEHLARRPALVPRSREGRAETVPTVRVLGSR